MMFRKVSQFVMLLVLMLYGASSSANDAWLKAHNGERANVGSPALKWDPGLASMAQDWANKRVNGQASGHRKMDAATIKQFNADCGSFNYCGENIWSGTGRSYTAAQQPSAVKAWVDYEKDWFDAAKRMCVVGSKNTGGQACDKKSCCWHYTQVISARSLTVGCAYAEQGSGQNTEAAVVCNYGPGGNYPDNNGVLDGVLASGGGNQQGGAAQGQQQGGAAQGQQQAGGGKYSAQEVLDAYNKKNGTNLQLDAALSKGAEGFATSQKWPDGANNYCASRAPNAGAVANGLGCLSGAKKVGIFIDANGMAHVMAGS